MYLFLIICVFVGASQSALDTTLEKFFEQNPHITNVTLNDPEEAFLLKCKWSVELWTMGHHGNGLSLLSAWKGPVAKSKKNGCDNDMIDQLQSFLPCTYSRGGTLLCEGDSPPDLTWVVSYTEGSSMPVPWDESFPAPHKTEKEAKKYHPEMTCSSISNFALAKAIQNSGKYDGTGSVSCDYDPEEQTMNVKVKGQGVNAELSLPTETQFEPEEKFLGWSSGVAPKGSFIVTIPGETLRIPAKMMKGERLHIGGNSVNFFFGSSIGQPRLCNRLETYLSCTFTKDLSDVELVSTRTIIFSTPHNVTIDATVVTKTEVIEGLWSYPILDYDEYMWSELPTNPLISCTGHVHSAGQCENMKIEEIPKLGAPKCVKRNNYAFP